MTILVASWCQSLCSESGVALWDLGCPPGRSLGTEGQRDSGWRSDPRSAPCHAERRREQGSVLSLAGLSCSSPLPEETGQKGGTGVLCAAPVKEKSWELISVFIREGGPDVFPPG